MKFIVVVREIGCTKPDYSIEFEAPTLPTIGSYLSIHRPDAKHGHTEDLVVRHVWWRLHSPTIGYLAKDEPRIGHVVDIQVECDQAIGPHSRDHWRANLEAARERGVAVEEFNVSRFSISEAEIGRNAG